MSIRRRFSSFREAKEIASSPTNLHASRRSIRKNHLSRSGALTSASHSRWCNADGFAGKIWYLHYDNGEEVKLLYTEKDTVRFKDFSTEVRCVMDMDCLLDEAIILLDTSETSLRGIIHSLLHKLLETLKVPFLFEEALSNIFLPESGSVLSKVIQGMIGFHGEMLESDQSWILTVATVNALPRRALGIVRLKYPENLGPGHEEVKFLLLILCKTKDKETKSAKETGRTFATLMADINFRSQLLKAPNEKLFKKLIANQARDLGSRQSKTNNFETFPSNDIQVDVRRKWFYFGSGLIQDLKTRVPFYVSDFKDGFIGENTLSKTLSSIIFLFFACILPAIAFGVLNDANTHGLIGVTGVVVSQALGGVIYALISGQPLLVIMTTAPVALYTKIIYLVAEESEFDFRTLYCFVGLFNSLYLILYSFFNASKLMRYSTRSTEEIFSLFICVAFTKDALGDAVSNFREYYFSSACQNNPSSLKNNGNMTNLLMNATGDLLIHSTDSVCRREVSILFLLLMFGTLWLAVTLYNFNKTPYLQAGKREVLTDYALPVAVICFSVVGSHFFRDVKMAPFKLINLSEAFVIPDWSNISVKLILTASSLGFPLSLLFFMDQNITASIVNNPDNKLIKGTSYHWDLFVIGVLNIPFSIFCLPWMHAVLPHSPLHVRSLADVQEHVEEGHVYDIIVKVRETRVTSLVANILIGLSIFFLGDYLRLIPVPVLDGLFLYLAVTALNGNQLFERFTLLFMEQTAYPPNHYIRRVPQRKIHQFTAIQVTQLGILSIFGFTSWPYIKIIFPIFLLCLLPIRQLITTRFIDRKYLQVLDGEHQ